MGRITTVLVPSVVLLLSFPARADPIPYLVAAGDTAHRIAARHGMALASLAELNEGLDLERLRIGQRVIVGDGRLVVHRFRTGESIEELSERYGVTSNELASWNRRLNLSRLTPGEELRIWARKDEPPSASIGRPSRGTLENGVRVPLHVAYLIRDESRAWVTREVASDLVAAFDRIQQRRPRAPRIEVRDASGPHGGRLRHHRSHQSGRDIDMTYFRKQCSDNTCGRAFLEPSDLDAELQWTLIEPWLRERRVEYIFIDHSLQRPLYEVARRRGATQSELAEWFQYPRPNWHRAGIVRHVRGHREHLHVRFACASSDERCVPSDPSSVDEQ